jgi:prepilin peptidase CpaA
MATSACFLIFPALMAFAASYDACALRITNGLCFVLAGAFIPAAFLAGLSLETALLHAACGIAALGFGFVLFAKGWIGGGDAKLFGAAALWFGWERIADFAAATAVAGGVLAFALLVARSLAMTYFPGCAPARLVNAELPYGIALACGVLLIYPHSLWARGLAF